MGKIHVVRQGETLSGIAHREGFADWHTIWEHGDNSALRLKRDPHVLLPGDEIFIPDRSEKVEPGQTTRVHTFEVQLPPLFLRVRVLDLNHEAVASANCHLGLDEANLIPKNTNGKGIFEHAISRMVRKGELTAFQRKPGPDARGPDPFVHVRFDLLVGHLDPETTFTGQQARLNNLGYFAGFTTRDKAQFVWAVEEFQCDHMFRSGVKKAPEVVEDPTGELDDSGVKDQATRRKLKEVHGF